MSSSEQLGTSTQPAEHRTALVGVVTADRHLGPRAPGHRMTLTTWCSDCKRAKQLLGEQPVAYDFVDVDVDADPSGRASSSPATCAAARRSRPRAPPGRAPQRALAVRRYVEPLASGLRPALQHAAVPSAV